jgi:hypothetical protein
MKKLFDYTGRLYAGLLLVTVVAFYSCSSPQKTAAAKTELTQAIANDRWIFSANQVSPQYGSSRQVIGAYECDLKKDTINVYLPYYGRAFSGADVLSGNSPLNFTSKNFTFSKEQNQKGGWMVTIKPHDYREVQSMVFTLYANGAALLNITMANHSPISYTGTLKSSQ